MWRRNEKLKDVFNDMLILARKNPLRIDPTRTTIIRRQFMAEMTRRFKKIRRAIWILVAQDDVFALSPRAFITMESQAWRFRTDASKVTSYRDWLRQQTDANLLSVDARGDPWTAKYVESSYKKGIQRAYVDVNKMRPDFYKDTQSQFLQDAFHAPEMLSKLELLSTRTFEELRGVTAVMSQQMSRTLATGLAQGRGPVTVARQLVKDLDGITKRRALVIARTEIIHAHAEGQLDSFDKLGIEKIGVMAEWSTAGDSVVCERCHGMEGEVMTVAEARGMIPLHPNCRCAWKPTEEKRKAP